MKNKKIILALILSFSLLLTGCGLVPSLNLTNEESSVISEYAAGLLLKHDKNYGGDITEIKEEPEEVAEEEIAIVDEEQTPATIEEDDNPEEEYNEELEMEAPVSDDLGTQTALGDNVYSARRIEDAIGVDGFEIAFSNIEVTKLYPAETDDLVFSMQAQDGKELLILHFNLTNITDSDLLCDVMNSSCKYRIKINGSDRVNCQQTILLNDLAQYYDNVSAYGMIDTVLVFEVAEGTGQNISSLDLTIKKEQETDTFRLL